MTDFPTDQQKQQLTDIAYKMFGDLVEACDTFQNDQDKACYHVINQITFELIFQLANHLDITFHSAMKIHCDKLVEVSYMVDTKENRP